MLRNAYECLRIHANSRALQNFGIPNAPIRIGYGDETETSIEDAIKAVSVVTALITQRQVRARRAEEEQSVLCAGNVKE